MGALVGVRGLVGKGEAWGASSMELLVSESD